MKMHWDQLHHLPVQNSAGDHLGLVEGVDIDVDAHTITNYLVRPAKLLATLFKTTFSIHPNQVIRFSDSAMIVKDAVVPAQTKTNAKRTRLTLAPRGSVELSEVE